MAEARLKPDADHLQLHCNTVCVVLFSRQREMPIPISLTVLHSKRSSQVVQKYTDCLSEVLVTAQMTTHDQFYWSAVLDTIRTEVGAAVIKLAS
eukprot:224293-Pleurochrysis_carterae.AAC.4